VACSHLNEGAIIHVSKVKDHFNDKAGRRGAAGHLAGAR
jgi:hypothetical protein